MAITINGSGTITGISTGGLPDGIVDDGTLASSAVTSTKIADGTITNSDINASAAITASKLTGTGKVLQVIEFAKTGAVQANSSSYVDLYGLSITPSSASSKILIFANVGGLYMNIGGNTNQTNWRISRNGGAVTGVAAHFHTEVGRNETSAGSRAFISMQVMDEPATTSSVVYSVQAVRHTGSGGIQINDTAGTSNIILMEVGA